MIEYIGIVLTIDGQFCVAPPWAVNEGDLISLPDALSGKREIREVISVVTDSTDGEYIGMLEKYTGCPLPRITAKFTKSEVEWDAADNDR